jgi:glutathione S-transferase
MKLYDLEVSGNCYKVRLFAALVGVELELIPVDFMAGEHKQQPIIGMNPLGQLPILCDGNVQLRDSQAILVYLAGKYADASWFPQEPEAQAEVVQWLSTAANEIQHGPGAARLVDKFGFEIDKATAVATADRVLPVVEAQLAEHEWLALDRPTIADCAVMPYIGLSHEGGISLEGYPNIRAWINRIKQLPGFISMSAL